MMTHTKTAAQRLLPAIIGSTLAVLLFTVLLVAKSLRDFSHTGPTIRTEIAEHFMGYSIMAVLQLGVWAFLVALLLALAGLLVFTALRPAGRMPGVIGGFIAGGIGIGIGSSYQFLHVLLYAPGTILASWNYAPSHLVAIWPYLSPSSLLLAKLLLLGVTALALVVMVWRYRRQGRRIQANGLTMAGLAAVLGIGWLHWHPEPEAGGQALAASASSRPNIVMIGSDTLRADRIGVTGYDRELTPFIDELARQGSYFTQAYVPVGRTAPSIVSILTGTWPDSHGIRDNFVRDDQKQLAAPSLVHRLREAGYRTAAVGDWAASDIGKIDFGFEELRVSPDQWNFKYLLRQGPKDLRLYVSLFTGNEAGRLLVPQLYYLAGRPLSTEKSRYARSQLNRLARGPEPFLLMLFMATTHAPFGSEYPYYTLFSGADYRGDAKFAITGVTSPEEIARRQAQGRESFDVQQIVDLYDGAVRHFDDEVRKVVTHIRDLGIADNTIIVVFSDHGTDLFERGTWGQGNIVGVHDHSSHVPLLILDPRRPATPPIDKVTRIVDLAPTLLELAGLEAGASFEGVSLVPYLDDPHSDLRLASYNESGALLAHIHGLAENSRKAPPLLELLEVPDKASGTISISETGEIAIEAARQKAIRTDHWMAMRMPLEDGDRYALFDLVQDPDGTRDVASTEPGVLACFRQAFTDAGRLAGRLDDLPACLDQAATLTADTTPDTAPSHP